jgi:TPR repeat protein
MLEDNEIMAREQDLERLRHAYELIRTDRSRAIVELERLASEGSVMSAIYLADSFVKEPNIDNEKAEKWLKVAYERGSARGLFHLAKHYVKIGNYNDAEKVYLNGVSRNDGPSMYYLVKLYIKINRYGVASSEVRNLLESAAALGQVKAMHDLWILYIKGTFGIRNIPRGVFLLVYFILRGFKWTFAGAYGPSDRRRW